MLRIQLRSLTEKASNKARVITEIMAAKKFILDPENDYAIEVDCFV
jgi:hypothetical protein